jgi:DnaJ-class molecular chaperone
MFVLIIAMKKPRKASAEIICPACDGTGFEKVKQPTQLGRKIYPPKCAECLGKGRIKEPAAT